jgi:hypothetical protein
MSYLGCLESSWMCQSFCLGAVGFDAQKYKGRNVIERSLNTIKNWRELATRYDQLAITYRAAAILAAIYAWLRHLRDTP